MSNIDISRLIRTFDQNLRVGLETGASLAARHQHPVVEVSHWLRVLLGVPDYSAVLQDLDVPNEGLRSKLNTAIADIARIEQSSLALSQKLGARERLLSQDAAIDRIVAAMCAGLSDPWRPIAIFLLVGTPGTGKTETAPSLADVLYDGKGVVLTEAVCRRAHGGLLLDELDKAHQGVQEEFYQAFGKGVLRDGKGRDIDFKNATIFMTANTGSELLASLATDRDTMPEGWALEALLLHELQKHFKPAFLGRTTILPFMPLQTEMLAGNVDIQIERSQQWIGAVYGTSLSLSSGARVSRAKASKMGAKAIEIMTSRDLMPILSTFFPDIVAAGSKVATITSNMGRTASASQPTTLAPNLNSSRRGKTGRRISIPVLPNALGEQHEERRKRLRRNKAKSYSQESYACRFICRSMASRVMQRMSSIANG